MQLEVLELAVERVRVGRIVGREAAVSASRAAPLLRSGCGGVEQRPVVLRAADDLAGAGMPGGAVELRHTEVVVERRRGAAGDVVHLVDAAVVAEVDAPVGDA